MFGSRAFTASSVRFGVALGRLEGLRRRPRPAGRERATWSANTDRRQARGTTTAG
jgi:hypothetical protein